MGNSDEWNVGRRRVFFVYRQGIFMERILFFWNELKATFWFVPVLIIFLAILLALGFVYLDYQLNIPQEGISRYLFIGSVDSARSILTTISAAMIGVGGTVFSITLVALALASNQFGPRLIKNFMYDRLNQIVLGAYIATFIYCLIVLNMIKETEQHVFLPSVSISLAMIMALLNIILLIVFIHHIAVSIQADKVVSRISETLLQNIKTLFPDKLEDESDEQKEHDEASAKSDYKYSKPLLAEKNGYLQYIDTKMLKKLTVEMDGLIALHFRAGGYLVEGIQLGTIYSHEELTDEQIKKTHDVFVVGQSRTQQQDAEYAVHQMVEIAVRALSPGVNDPYTAIACIDNLSAVMSYLAKANFPSAYTYEEDQLRIIEEKLTFEGVLDAAFNQIRQFSKESPAVVIRLMEALNTINGFAEKKNYRAAVRSHAQMVLNMAKQSFTEAADLKDLEKRSKGVLGE
ncbi:MAG: DUF2254 domain-containing protein [Crocinitomicaceae bacterium]